MATFEVRTVAPEEGARLRDIRLRALLDAPLAFASATAAEASAAARTEGDIHQSLVAESAGRWVGVVDLAIPRAGGGEVRLEGLWVDPGWRGRGIGAALVTSACHRARVVGADRVTLWVGEDNAHAVRLYLSQGFATTGRARPVPSDHTSTERAMERDLRERDSGEGSGRG